METGILRNLLCITTQAALDDAEAQITSVEITTLILEGKPPLQEFNWGLLKSIHKALFSEVYDWAGQARTIEISKGTTSFARSDHIEASAHAIFQQLEADKYHEDVADLDELVAKLAHYYGELIVLHTFREGNGRTIRTFLEMLAEKLGWEIAWSDLDEEENIAASIAAYNGDEEPMRLMLGRMVSPIDPFWAQ